MWEKIEDAIRNIVLLKEASILRILQNYRSKRNFFEMIRFDFAVDNDLNVFIMEVRKFIQSDHLYLSPSIENV